MSTPAWPSTRSAAPGKYVASYFNDDKEHFVKRFFAGKEKFLERATSNQSFTRIVDDLKNPTQEKIVTAEADKNMLILAGPGAGKTRFVAHRRAFLLRVKRIAPRAILVLCFNRSAIQSLRQRLGDLVGNDMTGVTLLTFHGLALRLTGRSLISGGKSGDQEDIDFSRLITDAIRLLKGEAEIIGLQDIPPDEALIGRFSHILVDEYQDVDAEQYELVSLVAGKGREEGERKMAILAVGDDDQNIYRFRGASVEFIRKFQHDYQAEIHYLIENYRSTAHIIAAANCLSVRNTDRMKTGHPIRINEARQNLPPGGKWQYADQVAQGKVQMIKAADPDRQATVVVEELRRLQRGGPVDLGSCAVLAREWKGLDRVRSACEQAGIPVNLCWGRHASFPRLSRIREHADILERLRAMQTETITGSAVLSMLIRMKSQGTIWSGNLIRLMQDWQEGTGDTPQPASAVEENLYEAFAEQGRMKTIANGLFLATAHAVKGLEFDHVFILGDSWDKGTGTTIEDERRLYYVSMSRARETLPLFALDAAVNPHARLLSGDFIMAREMSSGTSEPMTRSTYHLLGMEDLFLDFAGTRGERHPSRLALQKCKAGERVVIQESNNHLELMDSDGVAIARLSKKAQNEWSDRLDSIREARIVALVRRYRDDLADKEFLAICHGQSWEVPIVEVVR